MKQGINITFHILVYFFLLTNMFLFALFLTFLPYLSSWNWNWMIKIDRRYGWLQVAKFIYMDMTFLTSSKYSIREDFWTSCMSILILWLNIYKNGQKYLDILYFEHMFKQFVPICTICPRSLVKNHVTSI